MTTFGQLNILMIFLFEYNYQSNMAKRHKNGVKLGQKRKIQWNQKPAQMSSLVLEAIMKFVPKEMLKQGVSMQLGQKCTRAIMT